MISKDQADVVADELLDQQRSTKSAFFGKSDHVSHKRTQLGFAIGLLLGSAISLYWNGGIMPGMGFGMGIGAVIGAYLDGGIRNKIMAGIAAVATSMAVIAWVMKHSV